MKVQMYGIEKFGRLRTVHDAQSAYGDAGADAGELSHVALR